MSTRKPSYKQYQLFRYPGSKSKLIANPLFRALIDPLLHDAELFYEGFVGSGAVSIDVAMRYPDMVIVVNDLDRTISGFWELVASPDEAAVQEFIKLVEGFPAIKEKVAYFRALRARQQAASKGEDNPLTLVERAYHALFFNRTTFSGIAMSQPIGGYSQQSEWKIDCRYNAPAMVTKFLALRKLFKDRLVVSNSDVLVWLQKYGKDGLTYLDPPYFVKGEALYPVSMTEFQHEALAAQLRERTNWILSYDVCPEITKLYEWTKQLSLAFRYSINGVKKSWKEMNEYLIVSPEIDTQRFQELHDAQQQAASTEEPVIAEASSDFSIL